MTCKRNCDEPRHHHRVVSRLAVIASSADAAEVVLSGSIKSAAGEKMGGVTVSAKAEGSTITTTVFTDEAGDYYFPPLEAGKYRVWAQALSFETAKSEVDLAAKQEPGFRAGADDRFRDSRCGNCPATSSSRACRRRRPTTSA